MGDTDIIYLGDGSDLQIQHNGNNSFIDHNGAGDLFIRANGTNEDIYLRAADKQYVLERQKFLILQIAKKSEIF